MYDFEMQNAFEQRVLRQAKIGAFIAPLASGYRFPEDSRVQLVRTYKAATGCLREFDVYKKVKN